METFSHSSYPDSRETEDIHSSDDPLSTYKVKLMCSDGGKIQPRLHDNQLAYIGGDTKILSVDHDVDALISVTNDEDLEHMMIEFDRLHRASAKAAKLRLFLFSLKSFVPSEVKSERQFVCGCLRFCKCAESRIFFTTRQGGCFSGESPTVPEVVVKDVSAGSECGSEDRKLIGDASEAFKQQTLDLKRLHIAGNNEQRKSDEACSRGFLDEYYAHKLPEKMTPVPPAPVPVGVPVYLLQAPSLTPVTGQVGKGYYGVQRVVQEVYSHVQQPAAGSIQLQKTTKAGGLVQPKVGVAERGYLQDGEVANGTTPQNSCV
ncbi:hypothetical protein H0E87_004565 [Populus deltoides]|uniref:PB1 domain-containing protein n=1 Tax=Populus deltoides TaxID=3696 RepID=A0A8T2ZHC6_POPDE|nr:hypothetical protein H0E87_004565 [Populus deltoides]